jgi:hypothetical protein
MLSIYENFEKCHSKRTVKATIGMSKSQFEKLLPKFEEAYHEAQQERVNNKQIKKIPSGGSSGNLDTFKKKLFFILFYCKVYPSFDVLGLLFSFSGGTAHDHIEYYLPILEKAFSKLNVLPFQQINTPDEMIKLIEKYNKLIIDCVEISCVRPQNNDKQKEYYSGKKKRHTFKSLVISDTNKVILFTSIFVAGSVHDYTLMKQLFNPELNWFSDISILLDLGFYGASNEYINGNNLKLPHKKPKKSKSKPITNLTKKQKEENKIHATTRVLVEHSIGGMKALFCITNRVRNHLDIFKNYFIRISAAIWNFKISF